MKELNLVILGPPGAGKGTQAELIANKYHIPHISTGDIFRKILKENSPLSSELRKYVEKGKLVPDNVVSAIIRERLKGKDTRKGFIIDGFPRTKQQALELDKILESEKRVLSLAIYLVTSMNVILERLAGRRVCLHCGANYHIKNEPPKEEGICDRCGGELYQREDDKIETVKKRLQIYWDLTKEIVDYYQEKDILFKVSGDLDKNIVFDKISTQIENLNHKYELNYGKD